MSGFDDLPGFGAGPSFGDDLPSFQQPSRAPAAPASQPPQSQSQHSPYPNQQHHHYSQQQQGGGGYGAPPPRSYHDQQQAPYGGGGGSAGGSLGLGPMVGGRGGPAPSFAPRSYDLPPPQAGHGGPPPPHHGGGGYGGPPSGGYHRPPPSGPTTRNPGEPTNTVFIGGAAPHHTEDFLRGHFQRFGKVLRVSARLDKGIAFVHYEHVHEAKHAVDEAVRESFLGPSRVGFGKMFQYEAEEVARMEQAQANRRSNVDSFRGGPPGGPMGGPMGGAPGGGGFGPRDSEPSNIVWVGEVTPMLTDEDLRQHFAPFGTVTNIARVDHKGIAFVHYASVEEASRALRSLRGLPLRGCMLKLNFGKSRTEPQAGGGPGGAGGAPERDERNPPTNVVWLGLPNSATQADVDNLLQPFDGFIDSKHFADRSCAFGHFDTVEQAVACKQALTGQTLNGHPLHVGFGKANHNRTRGGANVATFGGGGAMPAAFDQFGNPVLVPPSGALITTNQSSGYGGGDLTLLPSEGGAGGAGATGAMVPSYMSAQRQAPTITLDHRVSALGGCSYFTCNVPPPHLMHSAVTEICAVVDATVDASTAQDLTNAIKRHETASLAPHLFTVIAKRLYDGYMDDPHKRLHVLFASALALHEMARPSAAAFAFAVLLSVAAKKQCKEGFQSVEAVMNSTRRYLNANDSVEAVVLREYDAIVQRWNQDNSLGSLLAKVQAATTSSSN